MRVGRPSLLRGGAEDGGGFVQAGEIRQYIRPPLHIRPPLPSRGRESQSTGDDSATGDHGQGLRSVWSHSTRGADVSEQLVRLRHEADHVCRSSGCLTADATGKEGAHSGIVEGDAGPPAALVNGRPAGHPSRPVEFSLSSSARKSMPARVDFGVSVWLCFSRSRDRARPGRDELPGSSTQLQLAGRCGGGVPKPERLQDGDGTDDRTGWPAVIRGRHEQYSSGSTRK